jgi:hypothetical protein
MIMTRDNAPSAPNCGPCGGIGHWHGRDDNEGKQYRCYNCGGSGLASKCGAFQCERWTDHNFCYKHWDMLPGRLRWTVEIREARRFIATAEGTARQLELEEKAEEEARRKKEAPKLDAEQHRSNGHQRQEAKVGGWRAAFALQPLTA